MDRITVILTAYKRDYFREQISAIRSQTGVEIDTIFLWQNEAHVNVDQMRESGVKLVKSDHNFKFWGRFSLAFMARTSFVAIFDDDMVPGEEWLANAIRCCQQHNCIAGANGRIFDGKSDWYRVGDQGRVLADTPVDFVGHCWVFRTEYLKAFFVERPHSFENGEDLHFSLSAKLNYGIDSYVVRQVNERTSAAARDFGRDEHATHLVLPKHDAVRMEIFRYWTDRGYVPRHPPGQLHQGADKVLEKLKYWRERRREGE